MGKDFDYVKEFEKHKEGWTREEILEKVRQTEKHFRKNRVLFSIMAFGGLISITIGPDNTKALFVELSACVGGIV